VKRLATVAVAALAFTGAVAVAAEQPSTSTTEAAVSTKPPPRCLIRSFRPFASKAWRLDRWRRENDGVRAGKPSRTTLGAQRRRLGCAPRAHRKAMRADWRLKKRIFYRYRAKRIGEERREREEAEYIAAITPPGPEVLAAIRSCESGGDYTINTGNGFYGAYQFLASTWAGVGGSGLPHEAPPREQDERAARLYQELGSSPWPVCGI